MPDHESKSATEPSISPSEKQQDSPYLVFLAISTHASLTVIATVTVIVGLATLPISYCVLAMHASSCYMKNANWAWMSIFYRTKDDKLVSFDGIMGVGLTFLIKICTIALLFANPPVSHSKTHSGVDAGKDDALMQGLLAFLPTESPETAKYYIGLLASIIAGSTFSLAYSVSQRS